MKFILILIFSLFLINFSFGMSPEYEKQLYLGCYPDSKKYIGAKKAKKYCTCTVNMLSERYNDDEIDKIFKKKQSEIIEATQFASKHCEMN